MKKFTIVFHSKGSELDCSCFFTDDESEAIAFAKKKADVNYVCHLYTYKNSFVLERNIKNYTI